MNEKRIYWNAIYELLRGRRVGRGRAGMALEGECWVFLGALDEHGYGMIHRGEFNGRAHRYVWLKLIGPTNGLHVLHRCDNPRCVRPAHLWLGTHTDNMRDMTAKGRGNMSGPQAWNAARTLARSKTKPSESAGAIMGGPRDVPAEGE